MTRLMLLACLPVHIASHRAGASVLCQVTNLFLGPYMANEPWVSCSFLLRCIHVRGLAVLFLFLVCFWPNINVRNIWNLDGEPRMLLILPICSAFLGQKCVYFFKSIIFTFPNILRNIFVRCLTVFSGRGILKNAPILVALRCL